MSFTLPAVFGHRGARAVKTENTLEAFEYACQSGIKWIELDVMLTKDNIPVVFHDETLNRLSKTKGRLDSFTLEELKPVILKGGEKIPTLEEVIILLNKYEANVNIEIKPSQPDLGRKTAQYVWQTLKQKDFTSSERIIFSSFQWDALDELKTLAPEISRGVLVEKGSGNWRQAARELKAYSIHYDAVLLKKKLIDEIKGEGYKLLAFTVNDPVFACTLWENGVDALFCDSPVEMMAVYDQYIRS